MSPVLQRSMFLVGDRPYCVWGWDLRKTNLEFLDHLDPEYFDYQAKVHLENLQGDLKHKAATALRTSYHHAMETFFALVCATLQAPGCIAGWFEKYRIENIRHIISSVSSGGRIQNSLKLDAVKWEAFSERVHRYVPEAKRQEITDLYAHLWKRLAREFLTEINSTEYNRIKHGSRAKPGGCFIRVGSEHQEGVPPPEEEMKTLGGSDFGSSFLTAEPINEAQARKGDPHFQLRQHTLNWNPESLGPALCLIALSIQNVVGFLKIVNGLEPKEVKFVFPGDSGYFKEPWKSSVGVTSVSMDFYPVHEQDITRYSIEEIRAHIGKNR